MPGAHHHPLRGPEIRFRLGACRITASNFASVHNNNSYCKPGDMLRQLLWPVRYNSCAMKYWCINEKVALRRFKEFVAVSLPHTADLPV